MGGGDHTVHVVLNDPDRQAVALRAAWRREAHHVTWLGLRYASHGIIL